MFTASEVVPELPLKILLPANVAVTVSEAFNDRGVKLQEPEPLVRLAVQLAPVVSVTLTEPIGTAVPLAVGDTVTDIATGTPNSAGLGDAATVTVVFSVKFTLRLCDALCAGGPGSEIETLKL